MTWFAKFDQFLTIINMFSPKILEIASKDYHGFVIPYVVRVLMCSYAKPKFVVASDNNTHRERIKRNIVLP